MREAERLLQKKTLLFNKILVLLNFYRCMKTNGNLCRGGVAPPVQPFASANMRTTTGRPYKVDLFRIFVHLLLKQNNHSTEEPAGLVAPDGKL